jgi:hypothetical protein
MTKQLVLGTVLGAIVLFVWSAIAWMVIPWPGEPLRSFTNEDAVGQAISANAPRSGNYLLPNMPKRTPGMTDQQYAAAEKAMADRWARGPIVFAAVRLEPFGSFGAALVIQFLTQLVLALLATVLLQQTCGLSRAGRIGFVAAIGVIIFVGGHVDEWTWWSFSNAYMLMQFGAIVIGWVLAALVISTFVRGKIATA